MGYNSWSPSAELTMGKVLNGANRTMFFSEASYRAWDQQITYGSDWVNGDITYQSWFFSYIEILPVMDELAENSTYIYIQCAYLLHWTNSCSFFKMVFGGTVY